MRRLSLLLLALLVGPLAGQEPFRQKLISVQDNLRAKKASLTSQEITPDCPVPWSITMKSLRGGKQEGVDLILIDNGKIQITLIPTRGLGIYEAKLGDLRLGWNSPVKEIVHPQFVNLLGRGGLGWLDGFNEFLCRCGLENNGQPGPDRFINNVGDEATMELTLHGKIANLPAQEVEVIVEKKKPYRLTLRGVVHERMVFGPKLELASELSTVPGSTSFTIQDTVTNRGGQPQEFQMLYHANYGRPILEEGARFLAPVKKVTPFNANAARDLKTWNHYLGPTPGYVEQVYLLEPIADKNGKTTILLHNRAGDRGGSIRFSLKELPYLTLWKNTSAEADGYVTGLEPGTNYPNRREVERKAGRVPKLDAGASHTMTVEFGLHGTRGDVSQVAEEIRRLQGKE